MKPELYIREVFEEKEGRPFKGMVTYCNDTVLTHELLMNFSEVFGRPFSEANRESFLYKTALNAINHDSKLWLNIKEKRDATLKKVLTLHIVKNNYGSITPMLPFEIYLIRDGYILKSFGALNAYDWGRVYTKGKKRVNVCFGFGDLNFWFVLSDFPMKVFQVDNQEDMYEMAISGKLKNIG